MFKKSLFLVVIIAVFISGCNVEQPTETTPTLAVTATATPISTVVPTATVTPTPTPTQVETSLLPIEIGPPDRDETIVYGYDSADFPEDVNPLNGLEVETPELLDYAAMIVSISNFPASARPQAGLSFAPMVYNFFIGQGMDRFLGVFYGTVPEAHLPAIGDCEVNEEIAEFDGLILGNRVWFDDNENGRQDPNELGVAGVCVNLLDVASGEILESTTTSSNGHFGFDLASGETRVIEIVLPENFAFTQSNQIEDKYLDSDIDPETGWSNAIQMTDENDFSRDAGFVLLSLGDNSSSSDDEAQISGYAWEDLNKNGLQDEGEKPVADVLFNVYLDVDGEPVTSATTDIFGHYQIDNLDSGVTYILEADISKGMYITDANQGDDDLIDSDFIENNLSEPFELSSEDNLVFDAGITLLQGVGPVRSGRLPFARIRDMYLGSCLGFAGQWAPLGIEVCEPVFNKPQGSTDINANFMTSERMEELMYYMWTPADGIDYSGNSFSLEAPDGGIDVPEFEMHYNTLNTSKWVYDELAGGWLRYHDLPDASGNYYPTLDRLNQKQLIFNNVIVMFLPHDVQNGDGTIIDTVFELGDIGDAWLFRDGKMYDINWSYQYWEWELSTWQQRPFKYIDDEGNSFALHPGNTWVHVVTPWTCLNGATYDGYTCDEPSADLEEWHIKFGNP